MHYANKHTMSAMSFITFHEFQCFHNAIAAPVGLVDPVDAMLANKRQKKPSVEAACDEAGTSSGDKVIPMPPPTADEAHADLVGPSEPDAQNGRKDSRKQSTPTESGTVY